MNILRILTARRARAFRRCFFDSRGDLTKEGRHALEYLAKFCHATRPTVVVSPVTRIVDTHATMIAEGRREVFNRITHYLNLDERQIQQLQEHADED